MKQIIGISGKMASGKDSFAEIFAGFSEIVVEKHTFGDKLKEVTELLTGVKMKLEKDLPYYNKVYNYTQEQKKQYIPEWNKTVRECLQIIGTDSLRNNFDKDVWVKSLFLTAGKKCLNNKHFLIIPDVRFKNEADYIKDKGGLLIRINGDPLNIRRDYLKLNNIIKEHNSETDLDNYRFFDYIINNEIPIMRQLEKEVIKIMQKENYILKNIFL